MIGETVSLFYLHSNQTVHTVLVKGRMTRVTHYIMLLFIAVGFVLLTHYFNKEKMPKKSIVPASALMFVLLIIVNVIKDLL